MLERRQIVRSAVDCMLAGREAMIVAADTQGVMEVMEAVREELKGREGVRWWEVGNRLVADTVAGARSVRVVEVQLEDLVGEGIAGLAKWVDPRAAAVRIEWRRGKAGRRARGLGDWGQGGSRERAIEGRRRREIRDE